PPRRFRKGPKTRSSSETPNGNAPRSASTRKPIFRWRRNFPNLRQVEYHFTAKHSMSDILKAEKAIKVVDEMADRLVQTHILQDVTFATGKSFPSPDQAGCLKVLGDTVAAWRDEHPEAKLAVFGHAD